MSDIKNKLLLARLEGIISTVETANQEGKGLHISKSTAEDFNNILREVADTYPKYAKSLPEAIRTLGPTAHLGKAQATFLDLQVKAGQLVKLMELLGSGDQ